MATHSSSLKSPWMEEPGRLESMGSMGTVYCHPAYLTYMKSTACKIPDWMKDKLESRLPGGISITLDM